MSLKSECPAQVILRVNEMFGVDNTLEEAPPAFLDRSSPIGSWLNGLETFRNWKMGTGCDVFWLTAGLGCGKTTLAQAMAEQLAASGAVVQRFFFRYRHQEKCTLEYCVRDMAAQLAIANEEFRRGVYDLFDSGTLLSSPDESFQTLGEHLFRGILSKMDLDEPLVWVLDGIDEAEQPERLLSALANVAAACSVKVFITSQPMHVPLDINAARIHQHFIQPSDTADDMRHYVKSAIKHVVPEDDTLQDFAKSRILANANGSFLWAKLAMQRLQSGWHTRESIEEALGHVMQGLTDLYSRVVQRIDGQVPRVRKLARTIIAWAACTRRPLLLVEMEEALKETFGTLTNLRLAIPQICGSLVCIDQSDPSGPRAVLLHLSIMEYLQNTREDGGYWMRLEEAHTDITITLLKYLSTDMWSSYFSSGSIMLRDQHSDRLAFASSKYPLLEYATKYWTYHLSKCTLTAELVMVLRTFLEAYSLTWIEAIALSGNMKHLTMACRQMSSFAKVSSRKFAAGVVWMQRWIRDFDRVASNFSDALVQLPSSARTILPRMCPPRSMVAQAFTTDQSPHLSVSRVGTGHWDDCVTTVPIGSEEHVVSVAASEEYFFIMVLPTWTVSMWSAATCNKLGTLQHDEHLKHMVVSPSGKLLVVCGRDHILAWDLSTRRVLNKTKHKPYGSIKELRFGKDDTELMTVFDHAIVICMNPTSGADVWQVKLDMTGLEAGSLGCAGHSAIRPDCSQVAMAWKGFPPAVWAIQAGLEAKPIICPMREPGRLALIVRKMIWRPGQPILIMLCQSTAVVEWQVFEDTVIEHKGLGGLDMALSADGRLLTTVDYTCTVSIYAFPDMRLMYRMKNLSGGTTRVAMAPCGRRLYLSGYSECSIWEPASLLPPAEMKKNGTKQVKLTVEQDDKQGDRVIRALADGPDGSWYACGRVDGSVTLYDADAGKKARKLYQYGPGAEVTHVHWSRSGTYIAMSDDAARLVVKRLRWKGDADGEGKWAVFPVLDERLNGSMRQYLFSSDEKYLLVSSAAYEAVWDLREKKQIAAREIETLKALRVHRSFIDPRHPEKLRQLDGKRCAEHNWLLEEQTRGTVTECSHLPNEKEMAKSVHGKNYTVIWARPVADGGHYVLALWTGAGQYHSSFHDGLAIIVVPLSCLSEDLSCAQLVQASRVKVLLGVMGTCLVFVDTDGWILTYNLQHLLDKTDKIQGKEKRKKVNDGRFALKRQFYVPKTWLYGNVSRVNMVLGADGTVFCPVKGDVAVIRNGIQIP